VYAIPKTKYTVGISGIVLIDVVQLFQYLFCNLLIFYVLICWKHNHTRYRGTALLLLVNPSKQRHRARHYCLKKKTADYHHTAAKLRTISVMNGNHQKINTLVAGGEQTEMNRTQRRALVSP